MERIRKKVAAIEKELRWKCLTESITTEVEQLKWQCENGHVFHRSLFSTYENSCCTDCKKGEQQRKSDKLLEQNGQQIMERERDGGLITFVVKCEKGHIYKTRSSLIELGKFCPYCEGRANFTINEMKNVARSNGGVLLSNHYVSDIAKLDWKCGEGHVFKQTAHRVSQGKWCPKCKWS